MTCGDKLPGVSDSDKLGSLFPTCFAEKLCKNREGEAPAEPAPRHHSTFSRVRGSAGASPSHFCIASEKGGYPTHPWSTGENATSSSGLNQRPISRAAFSALSL